jgi:hypothetical protein
MFGLSMTNLFCYMPNDSDYKATVDADYKATVDAAYVCLGFAMQTTATTLTQQTLSWVPMSLE